MDRTFHHTTTNWRTRQSDRLLCAITVIGLVVFPGCGTGSSSTSTTGAAVAKDSDPSAAAGDKVAEQQGQVQTSAAKPVGSPAKSKSPPAPTAQQIANWAIPDAAPLQLISFYDGYSDLFIECLAHLQDGKQFIVGGSKLRIWNLAEPKPGVDLLAELKDKDIERPIRCVAVSPNGNLLAAGDQKGMLRVWNLADQKELVAIRAHDARLMRLAFSPNSEILATTTYSGEVRLWKASDGSKIKSLKASDQEVMRLDFLTDQQLVTAGKETAIWNVDSGKQEATLTTGYVRSPALAVSSDRQWLAFADAESNVMLWDVQNARAAGRVLHNAGAYLMEFSPDGKQLLAYSHDSSIRIWNLATGQVLQVIDADGGRTSAIKWHPTGTMFLAAAENGRVRAWGTEDSAKSLGLPSLQLPAVPAISGDKHKPISSAQLKQVVDLRSLPRLPGAVSQFGEFNMSSYTCPATQDEAAAFYRYLLSRQSWTEAAADDPAQPGLNFHKDGCQLNVAFTPATPPATEGLQVMLLFAGNFDVRGLPKISEIKSKNTWSSFSSVSYRTKAAMTDVEAGLLKQFHDAGWTGYSRLDAGGAEQPDMRLISLIQGGSILNVMISVPADAKDELAVQTSVNVTNKSLPIPPDSGWIEFDNSTDLKMVANTKQDLKQTAEFYDKQMAAEGWLALDTGRLFKDDKGWLPYLRGQEDVLIRLVERPQGGTRVIIGDAERSSWQLQKPKKADSEKEANGIEAADFVVPKGATAVKFEVDQKQIRFETPDTSPTKLGELFVKQMEELEWKRDGAGIVGDDYTFITYKKGRAEIQLRAHGDAKKASAMISGDGLLWAKPLPTAPVRISFETWLRRTRQDASLDRLNEFVDEMHEIPAK